MSACCRKPPPGPCAISLAFSPGRACISPGNTSTGTPLTPCFTHNHTHTKTHTSSRFLTHTHTHTRTKQFTHSHTHTPVHSFSHTHTHTHARTHARTRPRACAYATLYTRSQYPAHVLDLIPEENRCLLGHTHIHTHVPSHSLSTDYCLPLNTFPCDPRCRRQQLAYLYLLSFPSRRSC